MKRLLSKLRTIFQSNPTYDNRSDKKLMKNAPWGGYYSRSNVPQDMYGAVDEATRRNRSDR